MESSTLSTHQLPIILSGAPVHLWPTHIPNPHQASNSELVWPLPSPPANLKPVPLAETMATGWGWAENEDGWTDGQTTKRHASHFLAQLFPCLSSSLVEFVFAFTYTETLTVLTLFNRPHNLDWITGQAIDGHFSFSNNSSLSAK